MESWASQRVLPVLRAGNCRRSSYHDAGLTIIFLSYAYHNEQSQMDWGHFGNFNGRRLYGFALTLSYSRMR
jgi:hypothetical protein